MSNELTHEEIIELLPLFALGALEPEEMVAIDNYVQEHPELQSRLEALDETVAQLAYAAPAVALPPEAKQKLMQRVQAQKPQASPTPMPATRPIKPRRSFADWLFGGNNLAWATAVSFIFLILLGGYSLQLRRSVASLRQTNAQLQADNEALQEINVRLQEEITRDETTLAQFSEADRIIPLPGTEEAPEATGVFLVNGLDGLFVLRNLETLPANQAYQLWLVPPGGGPPDAVSLGLLEELSSSGTGQQAVTIPADLQDFAIVDVSIEPAGGSQNLSGPVVIRARVEQ